MANQMIFDFEGKAYQVRLPNSKEREMGDRIFSRMFSQAIQDGCFLDGQIMKFARENGLWDDEKEADVTAIKAELIEKERILDEGGIELELAEKIAIEMKGLRSQLLIYNIMLEELKSQSANRKADSARTEYYVARCLLSSGRQVYKDLDDYYLNQNEDLAQLAQLNFSKLWYNYNEETFMFTEDKFLKEFDLVKEEVFEEKVRKPFLKNGKPFSPSIAKSSIAKSSIPKPKKESAKTVESTS